MRKTAALFALAVGTVVALAPSVGAKPVPGYVYPCSLQAGAKTRIVIGGMFMTGVTGAVVTGGGVSATRVVHVPGFPRATGKTELPWAREWFEEIMSGIREKREVPPEAEASDTDWARCGWWESLDERDDLELQVICRWWHTPENYPQPTPALDQIVIIDLEVAPDAKPGLRELLVYDQSSISAPHPFFITAEPHVAEPYYVIPKKEQRGVGVPHVLHLPPTLPVSRPPVVFDGQAWPGEIDEFKVILTKGVRYTFDMTARELMPYQGDAVPGFFNPVMRLFDPKGREIAYEDDFYYLPDPVISCVVPETGIYTLKIHDNLYRGRQDCVYTIRCYEDSPRGHSFTPQQRAFVCFPPPAAHVPPPAGEDVDVRTGLIDCPGRTVRHDFTVKEPVTLQFELFARRQGSPLDGIVRLYGPLEPSDPITSAPMIAEWDDVNKFLAGTIPQAICDPCGHWTFLDPGNYSVTVSDQFESGGPYNSYTLCISKRQPDFEIYVESSSFLLRGESSGGKVRLVRHNGFDGEVMIEGNEDFECGAYVGKGETEGEAVFSPKNNNWTGLKFAKFFATAEIGTGKDRKVIRRRVTPSDPAEQAFAYTHLLPQGEFIFYRP